MTNVDTTEGTSAVASGVSSQSRSRAADIPPTPVTIVKGHHHHHHSHNVLEKRKKKKKMPEEDSSDCTDNLQLHLEQRLRHIQKRERKLEKKLDAKLEKLETKTKKIMEKKHRLLGTRCAAMATVSTGTRVSSATAPVTEPIGEKTVKKDFGKSVSDISLEDYDLMKPDISAGLETNSVPNFVQRSDEKSANSSLDVNLWSNYFSYGKANLGSIPVADLLNINKDVEVAETAVAASENMCEGEEKIQNVTTGVAMLKIDDGLKKGAEQAKEFLHERSEMFSSGPNYTKLKTHLRLAINRLKLLEKKKTELTQKARKEIADYIQLEKQERAKIRVEHIIREDYLVEAMEIVEMYCDLLLARYGLVTQMKGLDEGISEAVSSIIWVAPRLQSDVPELKVIGEILSAKYGRQYSDACRAADTSAGAIPAPNVGEKLRHKLSIHSPPRLLIERYMVEIAKNYGLVYEPDPQLVAPDTGKSDSLLLDFATDAENNLDKGTPQPMGFIGYPPIPTLPSEPTPVPFNYPTFGPPPDATGAAGPPPMPPGAMGGLPYGAPFSYNIPPGGTGGATTANVKEQNVSYDSNEFGSLDDNLESGPGMAPKPQPRSKLPGAGATGSDFALLPDLPSVPTSDISPATPTHNTHNTDDIDFDDLTKRFEELKKRK